MRLGEVRLESQGSMILGHRIVQFALLFEHITEVVGDDAKKISATDVLAIASENFPIVSLSFGKLTGLMVPLRRL
jgi:hypothetical protein